ncbi:hypothetical protein SAY86_018840 [Trapa natans]|uniref:Uncharacterized protein n=1 Tax=Trapa natans TaxID=22666 RepID=A0AAN7QZ78_TRANT|nr:hypothetical protein SAY86_018840 [Trapa natans]
MSKIDKLALEGGLERNQNEEMKKNIYIHWWVAYRFEHPSGVVMVSTGEPTGGVGPEVEHKPWILPGSLELVMKFPTTKANFLHPLHFKVRILFCMARRRSQAIQIVGPTEASPHGCAILQGSFLMVKDGLVHTPNAKAWEAPRDERWRLFAVTRAETRA